MYLNKIYRPDIASGRFCARQKERLLGRLAVLDEFGNIQAGDENFRPLQ